MLNLLVIKNPEGEYLYWNGNQIYFTNNIKDAYFYNENEENMARMHLGWADYKKSDGEIVKIKLEVCN